MPLIEQQRTRGGDAAARGRRVVGERDIRGRERSARLRRRCRRPSGRPSCRIKVESPIVIEPELSIPPPPPTVAELFAIVVSPPRLPFGPRIDTVPVMLFQIAAAGRRRVAREAIVQQSRHAHVGHGRRRCWLPNCRPG